MKYHNKLAVIVFVSVILLIGGVYINAPGLSPFICAIGLFGCIAVGFAYLLEWLSAE